MIKHRPTGIVFENRKIAKQVLGRKRYSDISKRQEWEFINQTEDNK